MQLVKSKVVREGRPGARMVVAMKTLHNGEPVKYRVVKKKDRGQSRYHRALLLDYPNAADRERFAAAQRRGEIPRGARIGGLIEIHGEGGRGQNWTEGCVALSNRDMDDLFRRVGTGTRVTIVGGDGSDGAFSDLLARVGGGAENVKP